MNKLKSMYTSPANQRFFKYGSTLLPPLLHEPSGAAAALIKYMYNPVKLTRDNKKHPCENRRHLWTQRFSQSGVVRHLFQSFKPYQVVA
jgi:hypothetical protein